MHSGMDAPAPTVLSRREALLALAVGGTLTVEPLSLAQDAKPQEATSVFAGAHAILPLAFDPKSLPGLSEKLLVSHHDNNYGGAVKNLNKVEAELQKVTKDTPGFVVSGLKERELQFRNSKTLHELYFANLGGKGKLTGALAGTLAKAYAGGASWEEHFRATGASLSGGSGWVVLGYDLHSNGVFTGWAGNHTQSLASCVPLLVMDMYEHSYQMDYGASAAKYVDAFFANLDYEEVARRYERALKAAAALRV
jgi:Fe-Mn family superoxide dismutase